MTTYGPAKHQTETAPARNLGIPIALDSLFTQLKAEYKELCRDVKWLEEAAEQADRSLDTRMATARLRDIRERLIPFLERLEKHTEREEAQLVPVIDTFFHRSHEPTMMHSVWVMEKDQELARDYLHAFSQGVDTFGAAPVPGHVAAMIRCLQQGCRLLREHFQIEEVAVFPLAEELLTDLDALFS